MKKTYLEKANERRSAATEILRKNLKNEALRLVHILRKKGFKFKRIYIFGSVVGDKPLAPWSDVDLCIEGLHRDEFFKLYACLLKNSKFSVDLKPYEELDASIKEKIKKTGEVLYEQR